MKKFYSVLFCVLISIFLISSCGLNEKSNSELSNLIESVKSNEQGEDGNDQGENGNIPPVIDPPIKDIIEVDNLLEKYELTLWSGIWNDYMPGGGWQLTPEGERASIFCNSFDSPVPIPPMEVFATVITERITIPVLLYDIYDGRGTYGKFYRKDFRPINGIRLNNGEEYVVELTVKILGEQQTITLDKEKVGVTH